MATSTIQPLRPIEVTDLLRQLPLHKSPLQAYLSEAKLSYFGRGERFKGEATLAVKRGGKLRYDLYGPHSGVILSFATDGEKLQLLNFKESFFVEDRATPANIDALLPLPALHLSAETWSDLLFGEITLPEVLTVYRDQQQKKFILTWPAHEGTLLPALNSKTPIFILKIAEETLNCQEILLVEEQPLPAELLNPRGLIFKLTIHERDTYQLPKHWSLKVTKDDLELDVKLKNTQYALVGEESQIFSLTPKAGLKREYLKPAP